MQEKPPALLPLPQVQPGPEEQKAAPGQARPRHFSHLHPGAPKLLTPTPLIPALPQRNLSPVSHANSVRTMKSCWAFLWEIKAL